MRKLAFCALLGLGIGGCQPLVQVGATPEDMSEKFDPPSQPTVFANYNPVASPPVLPFPTNLIFSGTTDGTLNAATTDVNAPGFAGFGDPATAMSTLDGYSGIATAYTSFSGTLDESTVIAGDTVRVFQVELEGFFLSASSVVRELTAPDPLFGIPGEYTVQVIPQAQTDANGVATGLTYDTIAVVPTLPLAPGTSYVVVVTTDILDVNGRQIQRELIYNISQLKETLLNEAGQSQLALPASSFSDENAQALEVLRELNSSFESAVEPYGILSSSVAVSWAYTIASGPLMLQAIASEMEPTTIEAGPLLIPTGFGSLLFPDNPAQIYDMPVYTLAGQEVALADTSVAGFGGTADIVLGSLEVPFYLDPEDPVGGFWMGLQGQFPTRFYYAGGGGRPPEMRSTEVLPVIITVPNANSGCTKPAEGWPATVFVHTNTQNRTNILALADAFSSESAPGANDCVVGIGFDLPVSGIAAADQAGLLFGTNTYGQLPWYPKTGNLVKERYAINPEVTLDPAGATTFFNPASMLTVRDNIRQAVVDHLAAAKSIPQMTDTWTGTILASAISDAAFAIVPGGETDAVTGLPVSGPIRDLLDAQEAIVVLDETGAPVSGAGAITLGTLQTVAAPPAVALVTTSTSLDLDGDTIEETVIPTSGAIYDAIRAAGVLSIASDVTAAVAADPTSSAAAVAGAVAAQLDALGALGVTDGYVTSDGVTVAPYQLPDVNDATFRAELAALPASTDAGTFGEYVVAVGGLLSDKVDAVVANAQAADAGLAATVASFGGWNTAVDAFVALVPGLADMPEAVINALAGAYGLALSESAVSANMTQQILDLHDQAVGLNAIVDGIVADPGASPAILAGASAATLGAASAQEGVSAGLVASMGAPALEGGTGSYAAFQTALATGGDVAGTLTVLLGEAGGVAAAVSDCAALIVTLDDTGAAVLTDTNTAVGLTFAAIGQGLGDGGEVLGVGAYVGAVAAAVAAEAGLLQVLASAWKSSTPFIDPGKLAITGHAMGGVVALLTASLTDDYKSVIAASPTGGMAYAFEKSGTFGPALVAGLADAVGATPGDATWEQYFNVFQNIMGQADPLNFVDGISDSTGVLIFEFEDDSFFPNADASRPLTGSSYLIDYMGLERARQSIGGNGAPVRAAVKVNTDDSAADFGTYLSPLLGCAENDLTCLSANEEIRSELHQQTRSMIVSGGTAVDVNPVSATGAVVVE